jgi:hypothetical protein
MLPAVDARTLQLPAHVFLVNPESPCCRTNCQPSSSWADHAAPLATALSVKRQVGSLAAWHGAELTVTGAQAVGVLGEVFRCSSALLKHEVRPLGPCGPALGAQPRSACLPGNQKHHRSFPCVLGRVGMHMRAPDWGTIIGWGRVKAPRGRMPYCNCAARATLVSLLAVCWLGAGLTVCWPGGSPKASVECDRGPPCRWRTCWGRCRTLLPWRF